VLLGTIQHRAEAVFRLLNLQVALCLLSRAPDVTHVRISFAFISYTGWMDGDPLMMTNQEEEAALSKLLEFSHALNLIGPHLDDPSPGYTISFPLSFFII
jgi:hypothetical protein